MDKAGNEMAPDDSNTFTAKTPQGSGFGAAEVVGNTLSKEPEKSTSSEKESDNNGNENSGNDADNNKNPNENKDPNEGMTEKESKPRNNLLIGGIALAALIVLGAAAVLILKKKP